MNAYILDTNYDIYEMENSMFINYQTSSDGYGTISWYYFDDGNDTLSCDIDIDPNANFFWNDSYIQYVSYAVFDPLNEFCIHQKFPM